MKIEFRPFMGQYDWGWVKLHLELEENRDMSGIMAIDLEKNETVGAVLMENWTPNSVMVHQIITKPMLLRHGFFEEVTKYIYDTCGRKMMIGSVPSDNPKALKLDKKIGFEEFAVIKDGFADGVDIHLLSMTKEQCNFYRGNEHG